MLSLETLLCIAIMARPPFSRPRPAPYLRQPGARFPTECSSLSFPTMTEDAIS